MYQKNQLLTPKKSNVQNLTLKDNKFKIMKSCRSLSPQNKNLNQKSQVKWNKEYEQELEESNLIILQLRSFRHNMNDQMQINLQQKKKIRELETQLETAIEINESLKQYLKYFWKNDEKNKGKEVFETKQSIKGDYQQQTARIKKEEQVIVKNDKLKLKKMEIQDSNNNTIIPKVNENLSDNDSQILVKLIEQLLKFIFDPEYTKLNLNYFVQTLKYVQNNQSIQNLVDELEDYQNGKQFQVFNNDEIEKGKDIQKNNRQKNVNKELDKSSQKQKKQIIDTNKNSNIKKEIKIKNDVQQQYQQPEQFKNLLMFNDQLIFINEILQKENDFLIVQNKKTIQDYQNQIEYKPKIKQIESPGLLDQLIQENNQLKEQFKILTKKLNKYES